MEPVHRLPNWTSVRKAKENEVNPDAFAFLTTNANRVVGRIHPKAMPVILTAPEEVELGLTAPVADALALRRTLPDEALRIIARGERQDRPSSF